ncbi:TPA: DUF3440 domain-containing protein [Citrobacter freundii]|nr:DUF3440 domain-containing protein [Citrobacter freundii]
MAVKKRYLGKNVLEAAQERIERVFDTFGRVCVSFSGGKDSATLLHLVAAEARKSHRRFSVLFIDWEVQFSFTIAYVEEMRQYYQDVIDNFWWVALPLRTGSGVSQYQPEWISWERNTSWVRQPPPLAVTDEEYFPFYTYGMTFEEFIPAFNQWFAGEYKAAGLVGIRTEESLNRHRALTSMKKKCYASDMPWTTSTVGNAWLAYPLYDWKVKDIWLYYARTSLPVNPVYELMYKAGVPLRSMRICEPYGTEQRHGLWLYHVLDPEIWSKACERVQGASSGALYSRKNTAFFGRGALSKPSRLSWHQYALTLLDCMPSATAEHYRNKIAVYLQWYKCRGWPDGIPQEQQNDTGAKDIPSWRRICKCLLKNDYWCRMLSFSPTKSTAYKQYCRRLRDKRREWNVI